MVFEIADVHEGSVVRKLIFLAATFFAAGYFAWVIFASSTREPLKT